MRSLQLNTSRNSIAKSQRPFPCDSNISIGHMAHTPIGGSVMMETKGSGFTGIDIRDANNTDPHDNQKSNVTFVPAIHQND